MSRVIYIHPETPQQRLINQAVDVLNDQGVIVLPTDSGYALATTVDNKKGQDRMAAIRQLEKNHYFSLLCADLSMISQYAKLDNAQYRLLKTATPGPYTFILQASVELPKRLFGNRRKTIGIRVPNHPIVQTLLTAFDGPLLSTTLILPDAEISELFAEDIYEKIAHQVDLIIDGGGTNFAPTTVLDMSDGMPPVLIRQGQGEVNAFL
ncbi:L-threonylcarbamoyladenylate synthase [Ostreibacterium oceani]|uniref:Threonylcarbamoyl-AMP synthase n=1 Tax=Ostreibacterium oceani TaxID=2654998 RepID=A0A6N7ESH1_9GAMM|nr:L-threonylcarbamoyladenylate synthase [Ostreibacterium oceani]MPV85491.1 threonylcarbamoyl-AMP synthase [Ostreibacterium oceani]